MQPGSGGGAQMPARAAQTSADQSVLYQGIAKHSALLGRYLLWTLVLGGGVGAGLALMQIRELSQLPMWLLGLVGLAGLAWTFLRNVTTRYRVTLSRIEFERGILGKNVDSLELWRVLDVKFSQSLVDRMLQNGKIILIGTDQTDPEMVLYGLPGSRWIFERLREAIHEARRTGRPMELVGSDGLEGGGPGELA